MNRAELTKIIAKEISNLVNYVVKQQNTGRHVRVYWNPRTGEVGTEGGGATLGLSSTADAFGITVEVGYEYGAIEHIILCWLDQWVVSIRGTAAALGGVA